MKARTERTFVTVPGSRGSLFATLERPAAERSAGRPRRGVVFVHGGGSYRAGPHDLLVRLAHAAACAGFVTLRFDLTAHGESIAYASSAFEEETTNLLDRMVEDTNLAKARFIEAEQLEQCAVVGLCSGAVVALKSFLSAPVRGEDGVALLAAPPTDLTSSRHLLASLQSRLLNYTRKALRPATWSRLVRGDIDLRSVCRVLLLRSGSGQADSNQADDWTGTGSDPIRFSDPEAVADPSRRVLLVLAQGDVSMEQTLKQYHALCATHHLQLETQLVQGQDHSFSSIPATDEVLRSTLDWLQAFAPERSEPKGGELNPRGPAPQPLRMEAPPDLGRYRVEPATSDDEELLVHSGHSRDPSGRVALLVAPLFHERNAAHSSMVTLLKKLSRTGWDYAYFDARGAGENLHAAPASRLSDYRADLKRVVDSTLAHFGASRLTLVGLRFGATLAFLHASEDARVERVVALEPLLDGLALVRKLRHTALLSQARAVPAEGAAEDPIQDLNGIPVDQGLLDELAGLNPQAQMGPAQGNCQLWRLSRLRNSKRDLQAFQRLLASRGWQVEYRECLTPPFWSRLGELVALDVVTEIVAGINAGLPACPASFRP